MLKFVDVWCGGLALSAEMQKKLAAVLDDDERQKANVFKLPLLRERYIAVRGLLRLALASYLDAEPASLRFEAGEYGKPALSCGSLHFNLSHSDDRLLIAVADFPDVGIDIEAIKPRGSLDALAERCFSERELALWRQLPEDRQMMGFYRLWTKKEAFVKAVGRGLALGMELCEFDLEPGGQLRGAPAEYGPASAWRVTELQIATDACAALVTRGFDFELRGRKFEEEPWF